MRSYPRVVSTRRSLRRPHHMDIVGAFDLHRKQITFDYIEMDSGEVHRGRIQPADRENLRLWLERFTERFPAQHAAIARKAKLGVVLVSVGPLEGARSAASSSRASRLRYSVEMHRTPSSGIMHRMFVVRWGKRIWKERTGVCRGEQGPGAPGATRALEPYRQPRRSGGALCSRTSR